jgi:hypothetical protein
MERFFVYLQINQKTLHPGAPIPALWNDVDVSSESGLSKVRAWANPG